MPSEMNISSVLGKGTIFFLLNRHKVIFQHFNTK